MGMICAKIRLVAFRYQRSEDIGYFDTFTATSTAASIRLFLAMGVKEGLPSSHFDTEQAIVRSGIDTDIYLRLTPGTGPLSQNSVILNKESYSLKQASRRWLILVTSRPESFGFEQPLSDPCVDRLFEKNDNKKLKMAVIA